MLSRLSKWREAREARRRLERYPPYGAPFPGKVKTLEQAQANLDHLLAHRTQRLAVLTDFLAPYGMDVARGSSAADLLPLLKDIHAWTKREFPKIYDPRIARNEVWLASSRAGREIVFSLLMDLAILCGELVVTRRPEYSWSLDLDPENGADEMATFMRPVVQLPKGGPFPAPIIFDFEAIVVGHYRETRSPLFQLNQVGVITQVVLRAINGDHERYWLQQRS